MTQSHSHIRRRSVPVESLVVDRLQSRETHWTGDKQDRQLVSSISTTGLLQDLLVRPIEQTERTAQDTDGRYSIIAGSRRYQAALEAGLEEIPCKILELDNLETAWASLLENTDREDLSEQEKASQLGLIYESIRPLKEPEICPQCGVDVAGETGLHNHWGKTDCNPPAVESATVEPIGDTEGRFQSDRQARRYLAWRYLGRTDESAIQIINGHLRTAQLPSLLQSLFKTPQERSEQEQAALTNHGIESNTTLGSGSGRSKASEVVTSVYQSIEETFDADAIDPTTAVLETVGQLRTNDTSEKEFEKTLRQFRRELTAEVETETAAADQRRCFKQVLQSCVTEQQQAREKLASARPFSRVDVCPPESEHHNRWYARVHARRDVRSHGELIRELVTARLETLADERGWE